MTLGAGIVGRAASDPPGLRFGYGTNGFTNHTLSDAMTVLADLGYAGVALTLDHHHLNPFSPGLAWRIAAVGGQLSELGLAVVVETGARYLLDPWTKHHPTLVSEGWLRRVDFLRRAIRIAADLGAECVSFWSGALPSGTDPQLSRTRLLDGMAQVVEEAAARGVPLGLEPEPGHVVERLSDALALRTTLGEPELLGITLDVGHCVAVEPDDAATCLRRAGALLVNVQLDDMRRGAHEHLEFGEGELDLPGTLAALVEIGYTGLASVELPRHSHAAPQVARRALAALHQAHTAGMPCPNPPGAPAPAMAGTSPHRTSVPSPRPANPGDWLEYAVEEVQRDPVRIRELLPAAGREVGRGPLRPQQDPEGLVHGTVDDAARAQLLRALPPPALAAELPELYRYGDDAEKRGVLRALPNLGVAPDLGLPLVLDALRTNDIRLVAAAMGEYAAAHLDQHSWRHGVLKCVFVGVPLDAVARWSKRVDAELRRMLTDYAEERRAAGRVVPADVHRLLGGA
jgi:sugar phosphate isomerase/epimerase